MEFLDGVPLSSEIGNGKHLTPARFQKVFSQLLSGLAQIHEHGIIHRDLKPSNIILCRTAAGICPKIIDFGIARASDSSGHESTTLTQSSLLGSPIYMSPEQCKGARVDHLTDIYSLACVMCEALTGQTPHQGATAMEVMYKHMTAEPAHLADMSTHQPGKRLGQLIDLCLSKDPCARPQSAKEILSEMDEIFQSHLDTGKFFGPAGASSAKPKLLAITSACVAILVTASLLLSWTEARKNFSSKETAESLIKNEAELKKNRIVEEIESTVQSLNARYRNAQKREEKIEIAGQLVEKLRQLSDAQLHLPDYAGAEESLTKALPFSRLVNPKSNLLTSVILTDLANCLIEAKKYDEAEKRLEQANDIWNVNVSVTPSKSISFMHLKLEISRHRFDKNGKYFRLMTESSENPVADYRQERRYYSRFTKLPSDPKVVDMTRAVWALISRST